MNRTWIPAIAAAAVVAGVIGAIAVASLSDNGDDDEDALAEPTSTLPRTTESGLVEPPVIESLVDLPESLRAAAEEEAAERGYELAGIAATIDAAGDLLVAAVGIAANSSDGSDQRIFYFTGNEYRGTDWSRPVISIRSVTALESGQIEVVYEDYAEGDQPCCPSKEPFTWFGGFDGSANNPEQPPPSIFVGA